MEYVNFQKILITTFIIEGDLGKFDTLILWYWYCDVYSKKSAAPWIKWGFKLSISVGVAYRIFHCRGL